MRFSNKRTALILGESLTKARRWAKEFLPPDPHKGVRSGKTRRHSLNDVFIVFLGGYLVNSMGFSVSSAKAILSDISPWMEREGLLPQKTSKYVPKSHGKKKVERYDIYIMLTGKSRAFCYECRGLIRERKNAEGIVRSEYAVEHFRGTHAVKITPVIDHARILSISNILYRFKMKLSNNGP